jgi:hypothetical protein
VARYSDCWGDCQRYLDPQLLHLYTFFGEMTYLLIIYMIAISLFRISSEPGIHLFVIAIYK